MSMPVIQPHQKIPIEYLVSKNPLQHGLVLNHYMGTGKTLTAGFFIKNYPNDKIVIMLPSGLETQWTNELSKINVDIVKNNIQFYTYAEIHKTIVNSKNSKKIIEFKNLIKNSILIVDEAHILTDYLSYCKEHRNEDFPKIIKYLYDTKKILLMSGTISLYDFVYFINLCAGKTILPYKEEQFLTKFSVSYPLQIKFLEIIEIFIKYNPLGFLSDKELGFILSLFTGNTGYKFFFTNKTKQEQENLLQSIDITSDFLNTITKISSNLSLSKLFKKKFSKEINSNIKPLEINWKETREILSKTENKEIVTEEISRFQRVIENLSLLTSRQSIMNIILSYIVLKMGSLTMNYLKNLIKERIGYTLLDEKKLKKANLDKYFSFYKYVENIEFYPTFELKTKKVEYTTPQLKLLSKIMLNLVLEPQEYYDLDYKDTLHEAEIYTTAVTLNDKHNTAIGNLYETPYKFKKILEIYKKNPISTIVWSNHHKSGLLLFSKFLKNNNIKHVIFTPTLSKKLKIQYIEDFKNKKINLLLLHKDFYQGFSISGCRNFHILEPIPKYKDREQLMTRAIRYKSHAHLPIEERNVKIYQWCCTLVYDLNKARHFKEFIKTYFSNLEVNKKIETILSFFTSLISPDDTLLNKHGLEIFLEQRFETTMKNISIDKNTQENTCCIWNPTEICKPPLKPC